MNIFQLFSNKKIHDQKNQAMNEAIELHDDIQLIRKHAERALKRVEDSTAYQIAVATGGKERGL